MSRRIYSGTYRLQEESSSRPALSAASPIRSLLESTTRASLSAGPMLGVSGALDPPRCGRPSSESLYCRPEYGTTSRSSDVICSQYTSASRHDWKVHLPGRHILHHDVDTLPEDVGKRATLKDDTDSPPTTTCGRRIRHRSKHVDLSPEDPGSKSEGGVKSEEKTSGWRAKLGLHSSKDDVNSDVSVRRHQDPASEVTQEDSILSTSKESSRMGNREDSGILDCDISHRSSDTTPEDEEPRGQGEDPAGQGEPPKAREKRMYQKNSKLDSSGVREKVVYRRRRSSADHLQEDSGVHLDEPTSPATDRWSGHVSSPVKSQWTDEDLEAFVKQLSNPQHQMAARKARSSEGDIRHMKKDDDEDDDVDEDGTTRTTTGKRSHFGRIHKTKSADSAMLAADELGVIMPQAKPKSRNIAKKISKKMQFLRRRHTDSTLGMMKGEEGARRLANVDPEEAQEWSKSFESLLFDKTGLELFRGFLMSEHSDENIEFWIACENYKSTRSSKQLPALANKIFNDYVAVQSKREINLDSKTRNLTFESVTSNPNRQTFDEAQRRVQALMEKDSYRRFLESEVYQDLAAGNIQHKS
ncbi:regulator of G-protein signaling 3-like isoform X1 [Physella acuta]|uniref:regulator of G-protein signaling 3-like isoform X1 n=1 Tax=Physella acuta TaxID=109671 RepID=UPI0027DAEADB|nr:regulator of G-protein signaling 3-like isoform X1 [Physella acuta]XP_059153592.1 regulator of G-protein signaling 3-like isoform X1 [Physella acuta]XP_059153593.1 regulator of G-protein signaling 3-like isoform X1 [Physella acuta]